MTATTPVFTDSFEGTPDWSVGSTSLGPQWAVWDNDLGGVTARTGTQMVYSAGTRYEGTADNPRPAIGTSRSVLARNIDLTGAATADFSFWYKIPVGSSNVERITVSVDQPNDTVGTWRRESADWTQATTDLSAYSGGVHRVYINYFGVGGPDNRGAYLDDVVLATAPPEHLPPVVQSVALPTLIAGTWGPVYVAVDYADDSAIVSSSAAASRLALYVNGAPVLTSAVGELQSSVGGVTRVRYAFQWMDSAAMAFPGGTFEVRTTDAAVRDTSGNPVPANLAIGSFEATGPVNASITSEPGAAPPVPVMGGEALPACAFDVGFAAIGETYTVEVYLSNRPRGDGPDSRRLVGRVERTTVFGPDILGGAGGHFGIAAGELKVPTDAPAGTYWVVAHLVAPPDHPNWTASAAWSTLYSVTVARTPVNPTVVDVMVVYTPAASGSVGGDAAIRQKIDDGMAYANRALLNSNLNVQVRLVYAGPVDYAESGSINRDLSRLALTRDGFLDGVHALRDRYFADVVSLWTADGGGGDTIGLAYIAGRASGADDAFSVIVAPHADESTFAHELGHTFGAGHAPGDSGPVRGADPDGGLLPSSHGYHFTGPNGKQYRDLMSYEPGDVVPLFSSPRVRYFDDPTGSDKADNAGTIATTAPTVAAYRGKPAIESLAAVSPTVPRNGTYLIAAGGVSAAGKGPKRVVFYRDSDRDGAWSAADAVVGQDGSPAGGWTVRGSAAKLPAGDNVLFARAFDATGVAGDAVEVLLRVNNAAPVIKTLSAKPGTGGRVTVTISARDADGPPASITAWLDGNDNGLPDDGELLLTGRGSIRRSLVLPAGKTYRLVATALDADGARSAVTGTIVAPA